MKIRRRKLSGSPLLVASAGAALSVVGGCDGGPGVTSGNLVAPPQYELCIEATPAEAAVSLNGEALEDDGCNLVWEGQTEVTAQADGYQDYSELVEVYQDTTHQVELIPE